MKNRPTGQRGTSAPAKRRFCMSENLSHLIEHSVQIAWDYLERTGQVSDAPFTSRFLSAAVEEMVRKGEHRRLMLANRAITAFERLSNRQAA
jgi:hypothetical protein